MAGQPPPLPPRYCSAVLLHRGVDQHRSHVSVPVDVVTWGPRSCSHLDPMLLFFPVISLHIGWVGWHQPPYTQPTITTMTIPPHPIHHNHPLPPSSCHRYSLQWFQKLFTIAIDTSPKAEDLDERPTPQGAAVTGALRAVPLVQVIPIADELVNGDY